MKKFFTLICVFTLSIYHINAQSSVKHVINQIKETERYEGISLPGWLIRLGVSIASKEDDELRNTELFDIIKKIKSLRVATTTLDTKKYNTKAILSNFIKSMMEEDAFEEYVSIRSEDQNLKILVQEKNEMIKNLVIMSEDGGDIAVIHLKTNLLPDDLKGISFHELSNRTTKY